MVHLTDICMIFEVHQPFRLNRNIHLDVTSRPRITKEDLLELYFDNRLNRDIFNRVAEKCYIPANKIILEQIDRFKREKRKFKVSFSFSGVFIEQCERWNPDLLESFKQLVESGCVELLSQTYYHSLVSLHDQSEFIDQVELHRELMKNLFHYSPETFENTECLYNNNIARMVEQLKFRAIVTEGAERILGWRSPNFLYKAKGSNIKVLLRNYRLSDDIGFRFTSTEWDQWPLTADKYAAWLSSTPGQTIVIFLDYETFGEHYWPESGILEFLRWLPMEVYKWKNLSWSTPTEIAKRHIPVGEIDVPTDRTVSWADVERDISAWLGNQQQWASFNLVNEIGLLVKEIDDEVLLKIWRYLQTSDHFYYMCTKGGPSNVVHETFSPHGNPIESFITYITILMDFKARCQLEISRPEIRHRFFLRRLPRERCFHFFIRFAHPTEVTACSLEEFYSALKRVNVESVIFHFYRGDFQRWILQVIGDEELAAQIDKLPKERMDGEALRSRLLKIIRLRIRELKKRRVKVSS